MTASAPQPLPSPPPRVVLDTVVFVQALISGRGPAGASIDHLRAARFILALSNALLTEMRDVPLRPELTRKYTHLTPERVGRFVAEMGSLALVVPTPPNAFQLPRDPKDEPLIDLAAAVNATYLVTWNERHLTYLMKGDTPEGAEFVRRFPQISILNPPSFLHEPVLMHP